MADEFYEKKAKELFQKKSFQFKKAKDQETITNIIGVENYAEKLGMIVNPMTTIDTVRFALSFTRKELENRWDKVQAAEQKIKEIKRNES